MMVFKSRKDTFFKTVIIGTVAILVGLPVYHYFDSGVQPGLAVHVVNLLVVCLFLWFWFGTYYRLDATHIHYRCGPFRGKIAIDAIRELQRDTTMWSGFRPALARKGIIVKYNKYDEIYFSPDSNDAFIKVLLGVREDIPVSGDLERQNQSN